jgi:hypothetical protein
MKGWYPAQGLWMIWWMKHQMFFALLGLQFLNIFWYYLIWRILLRYVRFLWPLSGRPSSCLSYCLYRSLTDNRSLAVPSSVRTSTTNGQTTKRITRSPLPRESASERWASRYTSGEPSTYQAAGDDLLLFRGVLWGARRIESDNILLDVTSYTYRSTTA